MSKKNLVLATLLALLAPGLALHRFYVGKVGTGILQILTLGGLGLWILIDLIILVTGNFRDKEGKKLEWKV